MDTYLALLKLYKKHGLDIKAGLYPWHFPIQNTHDIEFTKTQLPFTAMVKFDRIIGTGGGLHILETLFLSSLSQSQKPQNIFIVGNSFGWSTFALALANPDATIVALDNVSEGNHARFAFDLSQKIAGTEFPNVIIIEGSSPQDVASCVEQHLKGPIDLALIDGLHTNEQQTKDFLAIEPHLSSSSLVLFHDVLNLAMMKSFTTLQADFPQYESALLTRTPSGMGYFMTPTIPQQTKEILFAFQEKREIISLLNREITHNRTCHELMECKIILEGQERQRIQFREMHPWIDEKMDNRTDLYWVLVTLLPQEIELGIEHFSSKFKLQHCSILQGIQRFPNGVQQMVVVIIGISEAELVKLMRRRKTKSFLCGQKGIASELMSIS